MDIHKNIAASMKAAMCERDMSLAEFSKELGIGKSSLQAYLNGTQSMRADTIEIVAKKLNITPAELVSGTWLVKELKTQDNKVHPLLFPIAEEIMNLKKSILNISETLYRLEAQLTVKEEDGQNKND